MFAGPSPFRYIRRWKGPPRTTCSLGGVDGGFQGVQSGLPGPIADARCGGLAGAGSRTTTKATTKVDNHCPQANTFDAKVVADAPLLEQAEQLFGPKLQLRWRGFGEGAEKLPVGSCAD